MWLPEKIFPYLDYPYSLVASLFREIPAPGVTIDTSCPGMKRVLVCKRFTVRSGSSAPSEEARCILPPIYRSSAKIVKLNKFSLEEIEEILRHHQPQEKAG